MKNFLSRMKIWQKLKLKLKLMKLNIGKKNVENGKKSVEKMLKNVVFLKIIPMNIVNCVVIRHILKTPIIIRRRKKFQMQNSKMVLVFVIGKIVSLIHVKTIILYNLIKIVHNAVSQSSSTMIILIQTLKK